MSRQSKSIAAIRADRRAAGQCAGCGAPSKKYRCPACEEIKSKAARKSPEDVTRARRAAVLARWGK